MPILRNHVKGGDASGLPPFYPYKINQSLRFNDDDSATLSWTPSVSGDRLLWEFNSWVKLGNLGTQRAILGAGSSSTDRTFLQFTTGDALQFRHTVGGSNTFQLITNAVYRDTGSHLHVRLVWDSSNATASDRVRLYINHERVTDFSTSVYGTQNTQSFIAHNVAHYLGNRSTGDTSFFDGYMSEVYLIQGQSLTSPVTEIKNNICIPKAFEGSFGSNDVHLDFADSGNIGNDVSGNNNDWSANNLVASDVVLDSPTNNFCTLNPLITSNHNDGDLSQGNLKFDAVTTGSNHLAAGTYYFTEGKYYCEFYANNASTGDSTSSYGLCDGNDENINSALYKGNGSTQGIVGNPTFSTYSSSDIIGMAVNFDDEEVAFYKNGVIQGDGFYKIDTTYDLYAVRIFLDNVNSRAATVNFGQDSTFAGVVPAGSFTDSLGIGTFKYQPPNEYLAVCATNLPETVISPSSGYAQKTEVPITYFVNQSLRFNDDDIADLNKLYTSAGNRKTWTFSTWMKRGDLVRGRIFGSDDGATSDDSLYIRVETSGAIRLGGELNNVNGPIVETQNVFNEVDKYYHVVVAFDSTQATSTDRVKIYVDGIDQILTYTTNPSLNVDHWINHNADTHTLGGSTQGTQMFDGYFAETQFIDGQRLTADDFGELKNGRWVPKDYLGSYGTNGFYLNFSDDQDIGADLSGNGNDWVVNNISDYDVVEDNPIDNFSTIDPTLYRTAVSIPSFSEGNLEQTGNSTSQTWTGGSLKISSGKWYWEALATTVGNAAHAYGVSIRSSIEAASNTDSIYYKTQSGGTIVSDGVSTQTSVGSIASGEVVGIYLNMDDREITFYKEGVQVGVAESLVEGVDVYLPMFTFTSADTQNINFGQDSTFAGNKTTGSANATDANGKGDFYYTPPAGALALTESNLPDTTVTPVGLAEDNFDILLWDGDGSASRGITGLTFQPDFPWIKERSSTSNHALYDVIRGPTKRLRSDGTNAEATNLDGLLSFDSNGFTIGDDGSVNENGQSYVAWNWKMGGTGVVNNDGSLQSTVSANVEAGQSIVITTGDGGTPSTVGHGLSEPLDFIIGKSRDTSNDWPVYHREIGATAFVELNTTIAELTSTNRWGDTEPTDEVFTVYNGGSASTNVNGEDYVFYCFHSVDGYSKFGSYEGNGNADGPFVYLGFRPRYILVKRTDGTFNWNVFDTERNKFNIVDHPLYPNVSDAEGTTTSNPIDILSNGFKLRGNGNASNASSGSYIYAAFAENPFKYANAR